MQFHCCKGSTMYNLFLILTVVIGSRDFDSPPSSFSLVQIAFAASDSVTGLKLMEAGLPREHIALIAIPMVPLQIILPWIIR